MRSIVGSSRRLIKLDREILIQLYENLIVACVSRINATVSALRSASYLQRRPMLAGEPVERARCYSAVHFL